MKIAILGFGKQGQSAYEYWNKDGNEITVCDSRIVEVPEGVNTNFEADYLNNLHEYDLIVRSPIIHPRDILANNSDHPEIMDRVTSATNEFFKVCPSKNIIAVTGTKGKGTTSTLIARLLEKAGYKVHLGGNIGISPLDMLKDNIKKDDWVVLELANFQLIDFKYSSPIAVCLMVAPEHLDWHTDMVEYIQAKQQLFRQQKPEDLVVYNAANVFSEEVVDVSRAERIPYEVPEPGDDPLNTGGAYVDGDHIYMQGEKICRTGDVVLLGRHNLQNVCASIAATWKLLSQKSDDPKKIIKETLATYTGLPHRLEILKKINGAWYVNDSFGTTPSTAIVAMQAFKEPKVLILGGSDKGATYEELAHEVASTKLRHVIIIGFVGPEIAQAIKEINPQIPMTILDKHVSMREIVKIASQKAQPGDVVLLSTACASFDMFKNYEDRGEQFKAAVKELAASPKP